MKKSTFLLSFLWPLAITLLALIPASSQARDSAAYFEGVRSFSLGLGNLNRFPGKVQVDDSGGTESFDIHPFLSASFYYDFARFFSINPEVIIATPRRGRDKKIKRSQYYLLTHGVYRPIDNLQLRLGLGWSLYRLSSDGGTQELQNGPDTIDFPMPEESSIAQNFVASAGIEYHWEVFDFPLSAKGQTFFYNLLESDARALAYTLSLHFHFHSHQWRSFN